VNRRAFIAGLGSAAVWPVVARAQQAAVPVIGLLNGISNEGSADRITSVRQGLRQQGFIEGQNVTIVYRSAEGQYDRLPALAADLVGRQVAVIISIGSTNSPQAARAATSTIPIVFTVGADPVLTGLVTNMRRPEANLTGTTLGTTTLATKLLEITHELLPAGRSFGFLRNPTSAFDILEAAGLSEAARILGSQFLVFGASTEQEIRVAFQSMAQQQLAALIVSGDASLYIHREQIVELAATHAIPAIYPLGAWVQAGGLMSYAPPLLDLYRQTGIYAGRILKGEKPADLPVQRPTKFELIINLKTAKTLGLTIPETLLATADEVIQ
jgi:putative ABC transport system substrate-binding protein